MNVVVLRGRLSTPPRPRSLPSGEQLVQLELTTDVDGARTSVPVVVHRPDAAVSGLEPGADLLVVGTVRRRFFRAGGSTASRTEVIAHTVVPAGRTRQVRAALGRAARDLDAADLAGVRGG